MRLLYDSAPEIVMAPENEADRRANEQEWDRRSSELLRDHQGRWILIAGGKFRGPHKTMDEAHAAGVLFDPRASLYIRWISVGDDGRSIRPLPPLPDAPTAPKGEYRRAFSSGEGFVRNGLLLPCSVSLDSIREGAIGGIARAVSGNLLIDTAAAETCLSLRVIEELGIPYEGPRPAQDAAGNERDAGIYYCAMHFEQGLPPVLSTFVSSTGFRGDGIIGILGRSMLARGIMSFDALAREWRISW